MQKRQNLEVVDLLLENYVLVSLESLPLPIKAELPGSDPEHEYSVTLPRDALVLRKYHPLGCSYQTLNPSINQTWPASLLQATAIQHCHSLSELAHYYSVAEFIPLFPLIPLR